MFKIFEVFWKGRELTCAATWKQAGVAVTALVPVLAYAVSFTDIPITTEQLTSIAVGIITVVNIVLPYATSSKLGFTPKEAAQ